MGLFGKLFNGLTGKPDRTQAEIEFEKSVIKDGHKYAGMRLAQIINEKITSKSLAKQFVLEELDAARNGNDYAINFVKQSGFNPSEYIGAMSKTKWEGNESELEHLQLYFRYFLMQIKDMELMVQLSTSTVDEIMKIWNMGKYNTNDFLKSEITSIGKNDTFSKGELENLLKKDNGKDLLEEGAENGNLECQQLLYTIYMIGAKIDKFNRDKFEYYTKLAAHQNDATAQFNHAKNIFDSIEEIKPEAMEKNGGVAIDSILSIQQKLEEAVFWYKKSGQNGNKQGLDNANNIEVRLLKGWINPLVKEYYE